MTTAMASLTVFFLFVFLAGASSAAARGNRMRDSSLSREELADMAGYGEDKISTILVTGSVLCDYHGHHHPSQPVSGAVVAINCGGSRRRRSSSSTRGRGRGRRGVMIKGVTDDYGDFTIDLPSSLHAIPNLHKRCSLTLLHLPTHLSRHCIKPPSNSKHHGHRHKPLLLLTSSSSEDEEEENGARTYSAGTIKLRSHRPPTPI